MSVSLREFPRILAFDSSTNRLAAGVQAADGSRRIHWGEGGSHASPRLIRLCLELLQQADLSWTDLDCIAVGVGPGAFTGLRAACAVAQGFSLAHDIPLLPVVSLDVLQEHGRMHWGLDENAFVQAVLDARMQQLYVRGGAVTASGQAELSLVDYAQWQPSAADYVVGNVEAAFAQDGVALPDMQHYLHATPEPEALLQWASTQWTRYGAECCVTAADLRPVYVRNRVAQTTAERMAAKKARQEAKA